MVGSERRLWGSSFMAEVALRASTAPTGMWVSVATASSEARWLPNADEGEAAREIRERGRVSFSHAERALAVEAAR